MVKEVTVTREWPGIAPEAYFQAVYDDPGCVRAFHLEAHNEPDTQVGSWVHGERSVSYSMPLEAPAFIKRIVGVDVIKVNEAQSVERRAGGLIAVRIVPTPDIPGGSKFSSSIETLLAPAGPGGANCLLKAKVVCSASGPYGLTGTIEGFMAETAKVNLQEWMDFVQRYLEQHPPAAAAPQAVPAGEEGVDQFFDAEEVPGAVAEDQGPAIPPPVELPPELPLVPSGPLSFEDTLLLYLRYMARTGDQSCALMETMDRRLQSLERDMRAIRAAFVLPEGGAAPAVTAPPVGAAAAAGAAAARQQQAAQRRRAQGQGQGQVQGQVQVQAAAGRQVSLAKAVIGAGLVATASVAATAYYFKRSQS